MVVNYLISVLVTHCGGKIDDMSNSNNGDVSKVLATVIQIVIDFLERNKGATVFFTGSTPGRTNLYNRILRKQYLSYKDKYHIMASVWVKNKFVLGEFDPGFTGEYSEYYVTRKN